MPLPKKRGRPVLCKNSYSLTRTWVPIFIPSLDCHFVYRLGMAANFRRSAAPLITPVQKLFSEDLAKENDFPRQENKILRSKLGKRVR